jgi:alkaline phosphatase D
MKRRIFLQGLGLSAIATRGYTANADAAARFTHGVASGDPLSDRVILWTRAIPQKANDALTVFWQVATDQGFSRVVASGQTTASAGSDYTVKVDATGLQPDQRYFYRFNARGVSSATGTTKTLPNGLATTFTMGVASCSNFPQGFFNAYRHMAESDLDLVLHLGDYIYEYPEAGYANDYAREVLKRSVVPQHEVVALEDYRMRYGLYRTDPDLQALHQRHPFVCVWDDHELANNTWREGAENHNEGEGDFHQRIAAARQAYHEWMPIRTANEGVQGPIYRRFEIGNLADLIMLDTRLVGRDRGLEYATDMLYAPAVAGEAPVADVAAFKDQRLNDPTRSLLGQDQEAWLDDALRQSVDRGAVWQVLGQQVLMGSVGIPSIPTDDLARGEMTQEQRQYIAFMQALGAQGMPLNLDAWDGYPLCRDRVKAMLSRDKTNPVVLAGDTHNAWAFNLLDHHEQPLGVEIGTPGISSPGMESYLPVPAADLAAALKAASPELSAVDTSQRGWSEISLTPQSMSNKWHFVSTILDRRYEVSSSGPMVCQKGARRFS